MSPVRTFYKPLRKSDLKVTGIMTGGVQSSLANMPEKLELLPIVPEVQDSPDFILVQNNRRLKTPGTMSKSRNSNLVSSDRSASN